MIKKISLLDILGYIVLTAIILFNLYLYYPETQILADPNDNIFQYSLVNRTNWVWENYGCPISLSCLPNLIDHNVPTWAEGYPLPFYYSHIPQIAIVSSYNLFILPISKIFNFQFSIFNYYNWTKYLLLAFFPLSVFVALRLVGFSPIIASLGSFFASHFSTDGLYGIDPPSFLWRGYGLTSQLYAMFFLPLGIAYIFRVLKAISSTPKVQVFSFNTFWAIFFLALTIAGHLGIGIIGLISTIPFLFLDLNKRNIINRGKKLFLVLGSVFLVLSYWIIPILLNNQYHIISFWDPIWKFNSYGWYEVVRQFLAGEIFDWQRAPIIIFLTLIGFFSLLTNKKLFPFSLLFSLWILLYFGRTTWGSLIDLIPGMRDFHQHRFIVGIHIAALFLIPAGIEYLYQINRKIIDFSIKKTSPLASPLLIGDGKGEVFGLLGYWVIGLFILILAYFTAKQTVTYNSLNSRWIYEANNAYRHDEEHFTDLANYLNSQPNARIYAGRPGNWGKGFRIGSTQMYMALGVAGFDMSQFLPETWSMLSENEQNFDERVAEDYDLLNIRYVVSDKNHDFTQTAQLTQKFGPFELYEVPTSGWFDVVSSPMFAKSDKTNFINIVHLWHRSYPRRWKMHPLISVEKKPIRPTGLQKIIEMKDEVSYVEVNNSSQPPLTLRRGNGGVTGLKNIFSDFPFVFPEATVSGKIIKESVDKQTYSATIDVPQNCNQCMIMFKMSYHPNWKAKLDGQNVEKFAVFPYYLAVPAQPGSHTVEFTYKPNGLKTLLLVAEIATIVLVGIIFLFRKKMSVLRKQIT